MDREAQSGQYLASEVGGIVRSHIGSERPEPGPYKCMLTLTSKTRFGVIHGCQEQNHEGNLDGSPRFGWTGRPKADNILLVRWGVTFGIRAEDGSSQGGGIVRSHIGSERLELGPYKCMLTLTSKTRFGVMHGCQEQNREGDLGGGPGFGWIGRPKADNILLVRWGVTFILPFIFSLYYE